MAPAAGFANEAQARRLHAQALLTDSTDLSDVNSPSAENIGNTRLDPRIACRNFGHEINGHFRPRNQGSDAIGTVFYDLSATITVFKSCAQPGRHSLKPTLKCNDPRT
jgi:hypothetical protein